MTRNGSGPGALHAGAAEDEQRGGGCVAPSIRGDRRNWRAIWESLRAGAHAEAQARRARVLAHPDLAEALTEQPIGYARPEQWSGYVPPRTDAVRSQDGAAPLNTSARRRALVELAAEALRRESEEVAN